VKRNFILLVVESALHAAFKPQTTRRTK